MIKVFKLNYLDRFTKCYKNIIALSKKPKSFSNFVKQLERQNLSPFRTFDCCDTKDHCIFAFYNNEKHDLFNYDQIDKVITLIIENGYKIDYELTKIMIKNKSDKDLIFYITKN